MLYTLNITPGDPTFGLPASIATQALRGAGINVAGFSTTGVPGFAAPPAGTFATYRRISSHPTVALAMRIVTAPVLANSWGWKSRPDVPRHWLAFVRDMLQPMRARVLSHALSALTFGFAGFEKVWETDGKRLILTKLKPLLPEITEILVDDFGNFTGFRQRRPGQATPIDLLGSKAFCCTCEGECQNYYGRSRHENVRDDWSRAMQTAERLAQYHKKVAGVIAQLHYPEGTSRDASGVERSNDIVAQQILEAVSMGRSVRLPNLFASIDDPKSAAELAGKSQWVLSQFELGGADHSAGLLAALAYYDKQLFRGWLRPERVGLEAQHGSRADAAEHSQTGIVDSELVDRGFAAAFNAGVVDDVLALNFGAAARGAVWVEPSPISDMRTDTVRTVLLTLLNHPRAAVDVSKLLDVAGMLEDLDVPVVARVD